MTHVCPLGHFCTRCGGICTGPQSDVDAAHDDHYAEGVDLMMTYMLPVVMVVMRLMRHHLLTSCRESSETVRSSR